MCRGVIHEPDLSASIAPRVEIHSSGQGEVGKNETARAGRTELYRGHENLLGGLL
jgi:hypothetical protein